MLDPMPVLFESCVDSLDAALASAAGGADRIELCARLDLGGTTPDPALTARCAAALAIPVFAMIRPRGGPFVHDAPELAAMAQEIRRAAAAGADGVVFGVLGADGTVDVEAMRRLIDVARPLPVTCHRAIDAAREPLEALEALLGLGVDRVLTSGGAATAAEGAATIARLVARAGDALTVMAGGGVRAGNVAALVARTGVREVHAKLLPIVQPGPPDESTREAWAAVVGAVVVRIRPARA